MAEPPVNRAFLSLGSNVEPEKYLPAGVDALQQIGRIVSVSQVWESAAVGKPEQANYLNAAVLLETLLRLEELWREAIPQIEQRLDRLRDPSDKYAPRTIDIDVVLFNRDTIHIGHRQVPDPDILHRAFLSIPLSELDSEYVHPGCGRSLGEIAAAMYSGGLRLRRDVKLLT